jgi:hypothetical protein
MDCCWRSDRLCSRSRWLYDAEIEGCDWCCKNDTEDMGGFMYPRYATTTSVEKGRHKEEGELPGDIS